ncbi:hypothetical protein K9M79_04910 [Candidatus Woesearchaeota archaeon]|nr:hypothetical protein [Candidatus Woesearchaeota archaeon]
MERVYSTNNFILEQTCQAWKEQNPSLCQFENYYSLEDEYLNSYKIQCDKNYYETQMIRELDMNYCNNLKDPVKEECLYKYDLISKTDKNQYFELCSNLEDGQAECKAYLLGDSMFCNDMNSSKDPEVNNFHIEFCKIFSSNPNDLNCTY